MNEIELSDGRSGGVNMYIDVLILMLTSPQLNKEQYMLWCVFCQFWPIAMIMMMSMMKQIWKKKMYKSRALLSVEVISNYRPRCHV